jgi:hypothetical protein
VGKYLQADKPLFSILCLHYPSGGALRGGTPEHPTKEKKRSLKPPAHLYQLFLDLSLISSTFSFDMKKCRSTASPPT